MFVRNNTTCPHCGKSRTFDVTFHEWTAPAYLALSAECSECMAVTCASIHLDVARSFVLAATKLLPKGDRRRRCWRWRTSYRNDVRTRRAVSALLWELLLPGQVSYEALRSVPYQQLCCEILSVPGDLICHITFTPSLGQPLAS